MKPAALLALLIGISLLTVPLVACRKRSTETAVPTVLAEPMFKAASATNPGAQVKLLTDAMTTWEDQNSGRVLTNLSQLVDGRIIDQLPTPPSGRRFVIDAQRHQVVLGSN